MIEIVELDKDKSKELIGREIVVDKMNIAIVIIIYC
jgi:hypothetical protein